MQSVRREPARPRIREDPPMLPHRRGARISLGMGRHMLHRQDQQRRAIGGDQLNVSLVFLRGSLLRPSGRRP